MPDTNCLLTRRSPEHAIQMILQIRHLIVGMCCITKVFKKYCGTIFVNTAHPCNIIALEIFSYI